jgi:dTDP-4-dehydrorhamnose reductase
LKPGNIWVTGAGGLIGGYLMRSAPDCEPGHKVFGLTRDQLDLSDFGAVREAFQQQQPTLIVHCAALSKSSDCRADPALARKINVQLTGLLCELGAGIPLIFLSTDLVFDGKAGNYDESAAANPLSTYAETKVAAEKIVLTNPKHTVIRTSLNGGVSRSGNRGFNEELQTAWRSGRTLRLFTDEFRSPIPAQATALAIWEMATRDRPGLYHLAGSRRMSRWEIGQLLSTRYRELNPKLEPASLKEYVGDPRSPDTSLNSTKIQKLISFRLPGLQEWLEANPNEPF